MFMLLKIKKIYKEFIFKRLYKKPGRVCNNCPGLALSGDNKYCRGNIYFACGAVYIKSDNYFYYYDSKKKKE